MYVCMYVYIDSMYVCMYVCIYTHTYIYIYVYICIYIYIYICRSYVCKFVREPISAGREVSWLPTKRSCVKAVMSPISLGMVLIWLSPSARKRKFGIWMTSFGKTGKPSDDISNLPVFAACSSRFFAASFSTPLGTAPPFCSHAITRNQHRKSATCFKKPKIQRITIEYSFDELMSVLFPSPALPRQLS